MRGPETQRSPVWRRRRRGPGTHRRIAADRQRRKRLRTRVRLEVSGGRRNYTDPIAHQRTVYISWQHKPARTCRIPCFQCPGLQHLMFQCSGEGAGWQLRISATRPRVRNLGGGRCGKLDPLALLPRISVLHCSSVWLPWERTSSLKKGWWHWGFVFKSSAILHLGQYSTSGNRCWNCF